MKKPLICSFICLLTLGACQSEKEKKAAQRAADLKKDLLTLYQESLSRLSDPAAKVLATTSLANAQAKVNESKLAVASLDSVITELGNSGENVATEKPLQLIARAYLNAKSPEGMTEALGKLRSSKAKDELIYDLVSHYATTNQAAKSELLFKSLTGPQAIEVARQRVLYAQIEQGKIDDALKAASLFKDKTLLAEVFLKAIKKRIAQGKLDAARTLLESMEGGTPRNKAQAALASALFSKGRAEEAQKLVDGIESIWIRAVARAERSNMLYRSKSRTKATELGAQIISEVGEISDASVKEAAIEELVPIFLDLRRTKEALELARLVQSKESLVRVHSDLVDVYAAAGRFDEAEKLIPALLQTPMWGSEGVARLARAYAEKGEYIKAFKTAEKMIITEFRLPVVAELALTHKAAEKKLTGEELDAFRAALTPKASP